MKKTKCIVGILFLTMIFCLALTLNVNAATTGVAKIGDTTYETLQEAVTAGGNITLIADVTESVTIAQGTTVTIDLNGYTITNVAGKHTITNNGTLTINGTGTVDNVSHGKAALYNGADATCTLNEGTFDRSEEKGKNSFKDGGNSWYTIYNAGTITFNDNVKVITASENVNLGKYSSLVENVGKGSKMTINGGSFVGGLNTIKNDDYGTLTINGGTFKSASQYSVMNWNEATISGGTFENSIFVGNYGNDVDKGVLTIEGGIFNSDYTLATAKKDGKTVLTEPIVTINGGTFNNTGLVNTKKSATSLFVTDKTIVSGGTFATTVDEKYISKTSQLVKNDDGTYTVKGTISEDTIKVSDISNQTYTGSAIKPTVTVKFGDTTLKEGTDYTVSYKDNTNVGTATVTITGKGDYIGTVSKTFKITVKSIANCSIDTIADQVYTGSAVTPTLTVKDGSKTLTKGTDYEVAYKDNTNIGTATVTVTGKGNYTGTLSKTFKITIKKAVGVSAKTQTTSSITIKWDKDSAATGYAVYMSTSKNGTYKKIATITKNSTTSYKKTGLKTAKTYYFKVREYKTISGSKKYGAYSDIFATSTKTKAPTITKVKAGSEKATIKWKKVSGASGYAIYMKKGRTGSYSKVATVTSGKTLSYTVKGLKAKSTYYFKVKAYRKVDGKKIYSSYSSAKSTKIKKTHKVKKGDTLYSLAKTYGTTVKKLVKLNNIKNKHVIKVGKVLRIF